MDSAFKCMYNYSTEGLQYANYFLYSAILRSHQDKMNTTTTIHSWE